MEARSAEARRAEPDRQVLEVAADFLPIIGVGDGDVVDVDIHPVVPRAVGRHAADAGAVPVIDRDHRVIDAGRLRPFPEIVGRMPQIASDRDDLRRGLVAAVDGIGIFLLALELLRGRKIGVGNAPAFMGVVGHDVDRPDLGVAQHRMRAALVVDE